MWNKIAIIIIFSFMAGCSSVTIPDSISPVASNEVSSVVNDDVVSTYSGPMFTAYESATSFTSSVAAKMNTKKGYMQLGLFVIIVAIVFLSFFIIKKRNDRYF